MSKFYLRKASILAAALVAVCLMLAASGSAFAVTLANWQLEEGSGTLAGDSTGINNGTIADATWVSGPAGTDYALHFDGDGDYVNCGNNASLSPTSSLNIEAWVKLDTTNLSTFENIVSKEAPGSGYYLMFLCGYLSAGIRTDTGTYVLEPWDAGYAFPALDTTSWHKVGMCYDGSSLSLKYDDNLVLSKAASGNIQPNDYNLWIGGMDLLDGRYFQGTIGSVAISDNTTPPVVPEPSSLLGLGMISSGLVAICRKRK